MMTPLVRGVALALAMVLVACAAPTPTPTVFESDGDELRESGIAKSGDASSTSWSPDDNNWQHELARGEVIIHFVNVNQGDCTIIEWPDGTFSMMDCGTTTWKGNTPKPNPQAVRSYVRSVLGENPRLRSLILTHPDADHINMVPYVLEGVQIDHLYYVQPTSQWHYKKRTFAPPGWVSNGGDRYVSDFIDDIPSQKKTWLDLHHIDWTGQDSDWFEDSDCRVYLLAANVRGSSNSRSVVLMLENGGFKAMLCGDATRQTEDFILDYVNKHEFPRGYLDVDVLMAGHHGSQKTSTGPAWVAAVRPELSVASCGFVNEYGHPGGLVVRRLEDTARTQAPPHRLRWFDDGEQVTRSNYDRDIFTTGSNGNIVVKGRRNGSYWVQYER
ncbi:MAG: hypothetical protein AAGC72_02570 [Planctomycetota bacterium]